MGQDKQIKLSMTVGQNDKRFYDNMFGNGTRQTDKGFHSNMSGETNR